MDRAHETLPLETLAIGELGDNLASLLSLLSLLKSLRIGPKGILPALPVLKTSLQQLRGTLASLEAQGHQQRACIAPIEPLLLEDLDQVTQALGHALQERCDTRTRLSLEHLLEGVIPRMSTLRTLLSLLEASAEPQRTEVDLYDLLQDSLASSSRALIPGTKQALVRVAFPPPGVLVRVRPAVLTGLLPFVTTLCVDQMPEARPPFHTRLAVSVETNVVRMCIRPESQSEPAEDEESLSLRCPLLLKGWEPTVKRLAAQGYIQLDQEPGSPIVCMELPRVIE